MHPLSVQLGKSMEQLFGRPPKSDCSVEEATRSYVEAMLEVIRAISILCMFDFWCRREDQMYGPLLPSY